MVSMMVGGIFNAVAFAGAGFLFSTFSKHGYGEEVKRHNIAMEKLTADKEKFYQEETIKRNKQAELRYKISVANMDAQQTNKAFQELAKANVEIKQYESQEPQLKDYYTPSPEMEKYKIGAIGIVGLGTGLVASYFI